MSENAESESLSVVPSPGGGVTKAGTPVAFWLLGETDKGERIQDALYLVMTAHNGRNGELL